MTMNLPVSSNLARKFEFLQDKAVQRKQQSASTSDIQMDAPTKKSDISHLKEFYLQRLAKKEPKVAARLAGNAYSMQLPVGNAGNLAAETVDPAQPQASGQHGVRGPCAEKCSNADTIKDVEDLEVMCNNCYSLIKSSEAGSCTGEPSGCPIAQRSGGATGAAPKASGAGALLDLKLQKLRAALETRLQDASSKVNVMRHLTQLRYHIDTAAKWTPGCAEIGALSEHTVQQVKQLTTTSRVIAPAVYIFSKRIENVVVQKERELRKSMVQSSLTARGFSAIDTGLAITVDHDESRDSVADVNSIVSELDSDCGTRYAETLISQDGAGPAQSLPSAPDVGNVQDANDCLSKKSEDEQRRWFYSQCLSVKLQCTDKTKARRVLISDLYSKVKAQNVPIDDWVQWIRGQLMPEEDSGGGQPTSATTPVPNLRRELDQTTIVPSEGALGSSSSLSHASANRGGYPMGPLRKLG